MSSEQSKNLRVGTRVCFNGDPADNGKVSAVEARYVTITWRDGHKSFSGRRGMQRVELVSEA
jgi:hypothetical protein